MPTWADYASLFQGMDESRLRMQYTRQQMAAQALQQQQAQQDRARQLRAMGALGNALPQLLAPPPGQQAAPQAPNPGQPSVPAQPSPQMPMHASGGQGGIPPLPPLPPGGVKGSMPTAGIPPYRPMPSAPAVAPMSGGGIPPPPTPQAPASPAPLSWNQAIKLLKDQGLSGADLFEGMQQLTPIMDAQAKQQLALSQAQFGNEMKLADLQVRYDSLRQRAEDNALNRADREQAHADSMALRQEMIGLQKQRITIQMDGAPGSDLTPEDAKFLGEQLAKGDTSVLTNLGRGAQGAKNVVAVRKAAIQYAKDHGMGGSDAAAADVQFQGEKAGARTAGVRATNIGMAASEANQLADQALQVSSELPRSGARDVNSALNDMRARFGDARVSEFQVAINGFKNAYSRAISPSGAPTVHDKQHADELFSMNQSPAQFVASIQQAKREMAAALKAPTEVQTQQRERISGKTSSGPAVGTIEGGYRFKGGNPADPNSWEPASGSGVPK